MAEIFKHAQRHELVPAAIDKDGRPMNPVLPAAQLVLIMKLQL